VIFEVEKLYNFRYSYHYILDHFCEKYHVVAFDMRGYGDSDKPKGILRLKYN